MRCLLILAALVVVTPVEPRSYPNPDLAALALCEAYTRLARTETERAEAWWVTELTWREIESRYKQENMR